MPATPKRANRTARPGTRFPSEVVADNVRAFRVLQQPALSGAGLGRAMVQLGHSWMPQTVSEVEKARRNVTVDELCSLAYVLGVTVPDLLDPYGPDRRTTGLDLGTSDTIPAPIAQAWARDRAVLGPTDGDVTRWVWSPASPLLHPEAQEVLAAGPTQKQPTRSKKGHHQ